MGVRAWVELDRAAKATRGAMAYSLLLVQVLRADSRSPPSYVCSLAPLGVLEDQVVRLSTSRLVK